jgi:hypothetical protein
MQVYEVVSRLLLRDSVVAEQTQDFLITNEFHLAAPGAKT